MAETVKFWDRLSERYYRQPIADEESYRIKLEVTQALLRPDMEILEFGCGTGGTAIKHAARVRHIRAIDFSEAMLEKARARAHAAGVDNVTFEREDIVDLAMPDEIYDMVLGMSILHLLEDPDAVIAKVFAMLKPGGHFVSSTACLGDTMGFFKLIAPAGRALGLLPIINVMTADALVEKFRRAGFDIAHRWQPGKSKAMFLIGKKPG
ncbi:methyltransferase domain-containing protein [Pelagibacterium limicola]|uniref:methyltransferase domain-containing protein n=1 Tax=Pelagibacterium limicola TaxID=2791022 RepID=UPI0018AF6E3F